MRVSMLIGAVSLLVLCAAEGSAQFTGVVVPPPSRVTAQVVDTAPRTVAQVRDSAARVSLGNMKDWVDSAASKLGVPVAPVVTDTTLAVAPVAPARPADPAPSRATTEFREGAPAPNTATPIPLLALLGLASLSAGLWLLRRRRA